MPNNFYYENKDKFKESLKLQEYLKPIKSAGFDKFADLVLIFLEYLHNSECETEMRLYRKFTIIKDGMVQMLIDHLRNVDFQGGAQKIFLLCEFLCDLILSKKKLLELEYEATYEKYSKMTTIEKQNQLKEIREQIKIQSEENQKHLDDCSQVFDVIFKIIYQIKIYDETVQQKKINQENERILEDLKAEVTNLPFKYKSIAHSALKSRWLMTLLMEQPRLGLEIIYNIVRYCSEDLKKLFIKTIDELLDELTYQIITIKEHKYITMISEIILKLIFTNPDALKIFVTKYKGLKVYLNDMNCIKEIPKLINILQIGSTDKMKIKDFDDKVKKLQKWWREKLKEKDPEKPKQDYRSKEFKAKWMNDENMERKLLESKLISYRNSMRVKLKKAQVDLYANKELKSANELDKMIKEKHSIRIQKAWRGYMVRKNFPKIKDKIIKDRAATIIQTAFCRLVKRKQQEKLDKKRKDNFCDFSLEDLRKLFEITPERRDELQNKINHAIQKRLICKKETDVDAVIAFHDQVNKKFIEEYGRRNLNVKERGERLRKREVLLASIINDAKLLTTASCFNNDLDSNELKKKFSCFNKSIMKDAIKNHKAKLKSFTDPWWKKLCFGDPWEIKLKKEDEVEISDDELEVDQCGNIKRVRKKEVKDDDHEDNPDYTCEMRLADEDESKKDLPPAPSLQVLPAAPVSDTKLDECKDEGEEEEEEEEEKLEKEGEEEEGEEAQADKYEGEGQGTENEAEEELQEEGKGKSPDKPTENVEGEEKKDEQGKVEDEETKKEDGETKEGESPAVEEKEGEAPVAEEKEGESPAVEEKEGEAPVAEEKEEEAAPPPADEDQEPNKQEEIPADSENKENDSANNSLNTSANNDLLEKVFDKNILKENENINRSFNALEKEEEDDEEEDEKENEKSKQNTSFNNTPVLFPEAEESFHKFSDKKRPASGIDHVTQNPLELDFNKLQQHKIEIWDKESVGDSKFTSPSLKVSTELDLNSFRSDLTKLKSHEQLKSGMEKEEEEEEEEDEDDDEYESTVDKKTPATSFVSSPEFNTSKKYFYEEVESFKKEEKKEEEDGNIKEKEKEEEEKEEGEKEKEEEKEEEEKDEDGKLGSSFVSSLGKISSLQKLNSSMKIPSTKSFDFDLSQMKDISAKRDDEMEREEKILEEVQMERGKSSIGVNEMEREENRLEEEEDEENDENTYESSTSKQTPPPILDTGRLSQLQASELDFSQLLKNKENIKKTELEKKSSELEKEEEEEEEEKVEEKNRSFQSSVEKQTPSPDKKFEKNEWEETGESFSKSTEQESPISMERRETPIDIKKREIPMNFITEIDENKATHEASKQESQSPDSTNQLEKLTDEWDADESKDNLQNEQDYNLSSPSIQGKNLESADFETELKNQSYIFQQNESNSEVFKTGKDFIKGEDIDQTIAKEEEEEETESENQSSGSNKTNNNNNNNVNNIKPNKNKKSKNKNSNSKRKSNPDSRTKVKQNISTLKNEEKGGKENTMERNIDKYINGKDS